MNLSSLNPVARILAVSVLLAFQPCLAADESRPIVDVRFDAAYRQIESSDGDDWAPTWSRDDVLYTGNDDGTNFGGIPTNAIAFGTLVGNDPYKQKGISVMYSRGFYPRGPETKVKTFNTGRLDWYTPIVGRRFQRATGFLYATGLTAKSEGDLDPTLYVLNYIPITLSTWPLDHQDPDFVGGR